MRRVHKVILPGLYWENKPMVEKETLRYVLA